MNNLWHEPESRRTVTRGQQRRWLQLSHRYVGAGLPSRCLADRRPSIWCHAWDWMEAEQASKIA